MYPRVIIDQKKLVDNAAKLKSDARAAGLSIMGVTKVACAHPDVVEAFVKGGVDYLADSRVENLKALAAFDEIPKVLLRLPSLSEVEEVVRYADISLNSELVTIEALGRAAEALGIRHHVILMVDLGDLREGVLAHDALAAVERILHLPGVDLHGIGVNLTCYGGVIPEEGNLGELTRLAKQIEEIHELKLEMVSGGNSSSIYLIGENRLPDGINNLRLGEVLVLGRETKEGDRYPGTHDDAFLLEAEIIECKVKDSVPKGTIGMDAFGNKPVFEDKGKMKRGILAIGRQDVDPSGLIPQDDRIEIIGASSDHLIVDLTATEDAYKVGDILQFKLSYGALLAAMTSYYVEKVTKE